MQLGNLDPLVGVGAEQMAGQFRRHRRDCHPLMTTRQARRPSASITALRIAWMCACAAASSIASGVKASVLKAFAS